MAPSPLTTDGGLCAMPLSSSPPVWQAIRRADATASTSSIASSDYQVLRKSPKMNERGDFNGTCSREQAMMITPETPDGSCTSYFADVTDYCCAAVGGIYNATFQAVNVSDTQAVALDHPICATSNYADMFSCYQYVTESHCVSTTPVPYGVCNKNGPDTSRVIRQASSSAASSAPTLALRWTLALTGLLACSAIQAMAG
ncbi:hypothetical protein NDA11_002063 [Ustilago hordei]|uniref:Uncharacterized protein n=1 Tax=Ustilago hordei TaxID=120017 RepID=I2G6W0_USTHO|nr:uncharacterized protein UHO2_02176 [Ustilago hordei]KAJ1038915.1 hypothetical protein NDA10_001732 [Ustilago hordei]KAJ1585670.1 hypothetical protein NDA12_000504 [Ustilago hordei]KAJ1589520.1 hypothetical protein NDA15_006167 [Ustilago hordei]KAJ1590722.1 hypothetical protein NDA11_002063 [Ustilago hordei]KAJ1600468.1 hypothetical protein NDA14_000603 [Ustilago hordei]